MKNNIADIILKISMLINSEKNLERLLQSIMEESNQAVEADRSSLFILDKDTNFLWSKVALGTKAVEIRFPANIGIAGFVATTGNVLNIDNVYEDSRFNPDIDRKTGYQTRNILCVPMINRENQIYGVFESMNKKNGNFTKEDEEMLLSISAHAAIVIENVLLHKELMYAKEALTKENINLRNELSRTFYPDNVIGASPAIKEVLSLTKKVSGSRENILITGESGTGKELIAKTVHYSSPRRKHPLIILNCAAIPEGLLETELFGVEKGVATGVDKRIGKFEQATGGSLFLDEIADMSVSTQAKVLRIIQEKEFEKVGGRKTVQVDTRIIVATNKDLKREVREGRFREDLYYRLNVVRIHVPPLAERMEDVPLLLDHFIDLLCQENNRGKIEFTPEALNCLNSYHWPGNVRELQNEVKRLLAMNADSLITMKDLSKTITHDKVINRGKVSPLKEKVRTLEVEMIKNALEETKGNQMQTAKLLGLSRHGLIKKIKRYGLKDCRKSGKL